MNRPGLVERATTGSKSFQALNAHLLQPKAEPRLVAGQVMTVAADEGKKRIRQNGSGLNKTEQAFHDYLLQFHPVSEIYSQRITLLLANGVRYTPDFLVRNRGTLAAYETKGFMRDDAAVKLKVAASLYPWITFHLVTKKKGGGWDIQTVLP